MRTVQHILSLLPAVLLGLFIIAIPPVQAMTLPQFFTHDGLTIDQPLLLANTTRIPETKLIFGTLPTIAVTKPKSPIVLAEAIITPKPTIVPVAQIAQSADDQPTDEITSTPTQDLLPSPTPTPTLTPTPSPQIQLSNGGLDADKLFSMSNTYRASKGLPPFQKDDRACQLAASRAPEIAAEIAGGYMHAGLKARNLPYWNSENIITMRTEEEAFNWWINDTIHREQIEGNYAYSCVACSGNACAQEFTNFQPK